MHRILRNSVLKTRQQAARASAEYVRKVTGPNQVCTEPQPEGLYYKYIYSFDNIPEHFGRFPTNPYPSAYISRPLFESDNFEFDHHGQWWETGGNNFLNALYLSLPVILLILVILKDNSPNLSRGISLHYRNQYGPSRKFQLIQGPTY